MQRRLAPMRLLSVLAAGVLGLIVVAAPGVQAQDLLVFAAASLKDALDAAMADRRRSGQTSYASISTLARQIEQGAPADIFISANSAWIDYLEERRLVRDGSRADLLGKEPGAGGAPGRRHRLRDRTWLRPLGLPRRRPPGDGRSGPRTGRHLRSSRAREPGRMAGVEPHVARADNVRAALALVGRGEAPLGVVYRSDAVADATVRVVDEFPADSHPPIIYPVAIMTESKHPAAAALVDFLKSENAAPVFQRFGFTVLD